MKTKKMTPKEYGQMHGIKTQTIYVWLRKGTLPPDVVSAEQVGHKFLQRRPWLLTVRIEKEVAA